MERIDFINAKRILWCCNDSGITVKELSKQTKISSDLLQSVVDGEKGLTYNQIKTLADFFGRGIFFFLEEGEVNEKKIHSANFRTLTNQKPYLSIQMRKFIEQVEKKRDQYLWLIEDLGENIPKFTPPSLNGTIEQKANKIREWLKLSEKNDFLSYRHALEEKHIFVIKSNGYKGKWQIPKESPILGFSLYHHTMPVIAVKAQSIIERQTFTMFHELAHLILHQNSSIDDANDMYAQKGEEAEANKLAGYILVPDYFLEKIDIGNKPIGYDEYTYWLQNFRKNWGVSIEVILRRLVDTTRISPSIYNGYRDWIKNKVLPKKENSGNRKYRYREPIHIFGNKFVQEVLEAKNLDQITVAKASSYLDNLKIKSVHELEKYLVANA